MKLLKYQIHNILGVRDITFDVDGHHLFLVGGKNAQGKTSALTALLMALCGKRGMAGYPEIALRDGQNRGSVSIELSGDPSLHEDKKITVELSLRRKRTGIVVEEFRVVDSTGDEAAEPRTLLQTLFKLKAFDPLEFERMKPKQQVETIREMLGIDFESFDIRRQQAFDERRIVGQTGKQLAGQIEGIPKHDDAPEELQSVSDLMAELDRRREVNEKRNYLERAKEKHQAEIDHRNDQVTRCHTQIEQWKQMILEAQEKVKEHLSEIDSAKDSIAMCEADLAHEELQEQDLSEIKERISTVDADNQKYRENKQREELEAKFEEERARYKQLTAEIEKVDREKAEAVASAPWPVDGMELTEDGLVLNDLPFEQASTAQRILASTKIGMALNPSLRLLVCQHGSALDTDTLDALQQVLEDNDFQMILEIVTRTDEDEQRCAVIIEDGQVKE